MATIGTVVKNTFVGGEWAQSMYARTDLQKYGTANRLVKNFILHPHGGASNRGGTEFIGETKDSSKTFRLIPFQFSVEQSYHLELGDQYMRVYKDGGRVVESDVTISGATQADPVVITATAHGYTNGDWVVISAVGGMTELNGKTFKVANVAANTFELQDTDGNDIDGTGYEAYTSGGVANKVYEIATPYPEAALSRVIYTQSFDTMYLFHPTYGVRSLTRTGHTAWTMAAVTFAASIAAPTGLANGGSGVSYVVTAVSEEGEESVASSPVSGSAGSATTWSAVTGAQYYNVYKDANSSSTYGWIGQADTTTFTEPGATIEADFTKTPPQANNPFNAADDYPGVGIIFEQRLLGARTNNYPQTIWGSVTGNFESMNKAYPSTAADAYRHRIDSGQGNEIRWLVSLDSLIIGTSGGEWKMTAGSQSDAVTGTSVRIKNQSTYGSSYVQPLVIGGAILFVEGSNKVVRDLEYTLEADKYKGDDRTLFAFHLTRDYGITEWCYQQSPDSIIWCVREDGALIGMTYYKEHDIWGWHQHETDGKFECINCIRTSAGVDEVFVGVKRTINGVTRRYIEKMRDRLPSDDVRDAFIVDCGLSYDSPVDITGATAAEPVVITATGHGFSDGDLVDIFDVEGMTELNTNRYRVANKTADTFELQEEESVSIVDNGTYKWTASGSGTNEYYMELLAGGDPSFAEPLTVYENSSAMSIGTMGSLSAGEWDYGDNDSLGYDTVYVRLSDSTDPDTKVNGYLKSGAAIDGSAFTAYTENGTVRKAVTTIINLEHLEGKDVSVLADGDIIADKSVTNGAITLDIAASRVHIGLGYEYELETLDFIYVQENGTIQDKLRDITEVTFSVNRSREFYVGPSSDLPERLAKIKWRDEEEVGTPTALFSGDRTLAVEAGDPDEPSSRVYIMGSDPVPVTVLAVIPKVAAGED